MSAGLLGVAEKANGEGSVTTAEGRKQEDKNRHAAIITLLRWGAEAAAAAAGGIVPYPMHEEGGALFPAGDRETSMNSPTSSIRPDVRDVKWRGSPALNGAGSTPFNESVEKSIAGTDVGGATIVDIVNRMYNRIE